MAVLLVPNLGIKMLEILNCFGRSRDRITDCYWSICVVCVLNCGLGVVRPEIAVNFGSTTWNQCLVRGLPTDSPLLSLGLLKTVPGCLVRPKMSMC